jgi:hypothetical protein
LEPHGRVHMPQEAVVSWDEILLLNATYCFHLDSLSIFIARVTDNVLNKLECMNTTSVRTWLIFLISYSPRVVMESCNKPFAIWEWELLGSTGRWANKQANH